jgi:hypothetical protein
MPPLKVDPGFAHVGDLPFSHAEISRKKNDKALPGSLRIAGLKELLELLLVKGVIPRSHDGEYATSCISVVAWRYIVIVSPYKLEAELTKKRNISSRSVAPFISGVTLRCLLEFGDPNQSQSIHIHIFMKPSDRSRRTSQKSPAPSAERIGL